MKNILYINACVRAESRTAVLAREVMKNIEGNITEVRLVDEELSPLDTELLSLRDSLIREGRAEDAMFKYARQFAEADEIVIAAPFWDLSFPALLKIYFEQINVTGITFEYIDGRPVGLCRAKKLTYVTTAGGRIFADFGYSYVKALAKSFYGINELSCVRAEELDVKCISADRLLTDARVERIV